MSNTTKTIAGRADYLRMIEAGLRDFAAELVVNPIEDYREKLYLKAVAEGTAAGLDLLRLAIDCSLPEAIRSVEAEAGSVTAAGNEL